MAADRIVRSPASASIAGGVVSAVFACTKAGLNFHECLLLFDVNSYRELPARCRPKL
jgi:hypothetical protein